MLDRLVLYARLLRVKHYIKNILIFVPLFFSTNQFDLHEIHCAGLGFIAFSLTASVIYIINDLKDVEKDRLHPVKRHRPIASGAIGEREAQTAAFVCLLLSFFVTLLGDMQGSILYLLLYLVLNIAYSSGLKDRPIVDIILLSSGFLIRILYGAYITDIEVSQWLYLTVLSGAVFLGLGKRRNELQRSSGEGRPVLKYYSRDFLNNNMYLFLSLTNIFYALWAVSKEEWAMMWTVPLVMVIFLQYSMRIEGESDGDPIEVISHDKLLLGLIAIYIFSTALILYA